MDVMKGCHVCLTTLNYWLHTLVVVCVSDVSIALDYKNQCAFCAGTPGCFHT